MMGRAAAVRAQTKGKTDAAKAKVNARYGKMVTMCVKAGGADPVSNVQLAKLLEQAKQAGVPKTNMDNILKKANSKEQADFKESTMEIYAHGGVGFVLDILTDNSNRAAGDIRTVVNRKQLKIAEPGSVAFNFDRVGLVSIETADGEDAVTEAALDAGADDLAAIDTSIDEGAKPGFNIYTSPASLMACADALREKGYAVKDARFIWRPKADIEVAEDVEVKNLEAMEALEDLDDVDAVFTNMA